MAFCAIRSLRIISYFDPIFYSKIRWLVWCIVFYKFITFWYSMVILSYYFINLNSSIICGLSFGDIYLLLRYFGEIFLKLCNFISNFITNQITSCFCDFLNSSFWSSFKCIVAHCLAWSRNFWLHLPHKFLLIFLLNVLAKENNL